MRHQKRIRKLGRNASHRRATLANLASSLIEHKRIKTTHAKAKAAQQYVEPLITKARRGTLHDRRNVLKSIPRPDIVKILFYIWEYFMKFSYMRSYYFIFIKQRIKCFQIILKTS